MKTVELTPSGTNAQEGKNEITITKSGAVVFREQVDDLFKHQIGKFPKVDDADAVSNIEDAPPIDNQILFGLIRNPRVHLIRPIPIEVRREDNVSIAFWAEGDEFGHGVGRSEAIEDFGRSISQLFVSLCREENELGPDLQRVLGLLRRYMKMRIAG